MPTPMTMGIAFGVGSSAKPRLERPQLQRCFAAWIGPDFTKDEEELIREAVQIVIRATDGQVGFAFDTGREPEVRIVKDGSRPVGVAYAGLTYPLVADHVWIGAEIVLHPDWVRMKVIRHELHHVVGMEHPQQPGSVMSDLPIDSHEIPDVDLAAWHYMAEHEPGTPRPGLEGAATAHYHRPYVIVD